MILDEILCKDQADPADWHLCSTGDWKCASVNADVLRGVRPKYLKDTPIVYVLFGPSYVYSGKSGLTKRVRSQLLTKYNDAERAVLIWNKQLFLEESAQLHIESAITQALLVCGRPISNRALTIRGGDSIGMRQASQFLYDILMAETSPIRPALGLDEPWTVDAIRIVADALEMACECMDSYG